MSMNRRSLLTGVVLLVAHVVNAQTANGLMFNEVMQSNIDYLLEEKDFPDSWVELYNPQERPVRLDGYKLSEHADGHNAYTFPAGCGTVPAKGHLVVYCDKEGRGLHASFRIDSGKANLYLFDPQGVAVDSLALSKMPAPNIAYGRVTDGADEWQYEVTPSAGQANHSQGSTLVLPAPLFSLDGGLLADPAMLTMSVPEVEGLPADTKIYYTVDGTEPTMASRSIAKTQTFNVGRTMVIRAKLMSKEALSPVSTVRSFIFHPREVTLPVVSIVTPEEYIFGNELGIASPNVWEGKPNYMQSWRRPVNVEYFDPSVEGGKVVFNQLGETAISGVSTREQPQKSFKIYANKRFGKKTYKGDFWADKPEVGKVKSFVLRSGGNNSFTTRINDALVQKVFGTHVDNLDWQAYRPVVVYINGVYRGEFGMRERSNEDFVEANYDLEDVEMADETAYQSPDPASLFADFRSAYRNNATTYQQLDEMMDMDNFINTLAAEIYAMNTDFPTNNVSLWRPLEEGGKWRWILKDLDRAGMNIALYPHSFDMFNYLFNPDDIMYAGMHHFDLYQKMSTLPAFAGAFVDRLLVYLGDFLKPDLVNAQADLMSEEIYDELKATFLAYNCNTEWSRYRQNMKDLKSFFTSRPSYLYAQMNQYFDLGGVRPLKVSHDEGQESLNGVALTEGDFNGSCFASRPVTLYSGDRLHGWRLTVTSAEGDSACYTFEHSTIDILPSEYAASSKDILSFATYEMDQAEEEEPVTPEDPDDSGDEGDPDDPGDEGDDTPDTPEDPADALRTPLDASHMTIYSPSGQRRGKMAKGLNIVGKNGKWGKVVRP